MLAFLILLGMIHIMRVFKILCWARKDIFLNVYGRGFMNNGSFPCHLGSSPSPVSNDLAFIIPCCYRLPAVLFRGLLLGIPICTKVAATSPSSSSVLVETPWVFLWVLLFLLALPLSPVFFCFLDSCVGFASRLGTACSF